MLQIVTISPQLTDSMQELHIPQCINAHLRLLVQGIVGLGGCKLRTVNYCYILFESQCSQPDQQGNKGLY